MAPFPKPDSSPFAWRQWLTRDEHLELVWGAGDERRAALRLECLERAKAGEPPREESSGPAVTARPRATAARDEQRD